MLAATISQYLRENRRLVIPQVGAFLVKEPDHTVVFSQLITRDDGVLHSLLLAAGANEIEASGLLHRLQFDIRYVAENGGEYILEGVGRFSHSAGGELIFTYIAPTSVSVSEQADNAPVAGEPFAALINEAPGAIESSEEPQIIVKSALGDKPASERVVDSPRKAPRRAASRSKSKVDIWLVVGIAAVALALGAILYGFLREGANSSFELPMFEQNQE